MEIMFTLSENINSKKLVLPYAINFMAITMYHFNISEIKIIIDVTVPELIWYKCDISEIKM